MRLTLQWTTKSNLVNNWIQSGRQVAPRGKYWLSARSSRSVSHHILYAMHTLILNLILTQDISKLLSLASSAISLLALPQTDPPESALPQGEERSEQFVLEANEYFERLDVRPSFLRIFTMNLLLIRSPIANTYQHALDSRAHPPIPHRALHHRRPSSEFHPQARRRRYSCSHVFLL